MRPSATFLRMRSSATLLLSETCFSISSSSVASTCIVSTMAFSCSTVLVIGFPRRRVGDHGLRFADIEGRSSAPPAPRTAAVVGQRRGGGGAAPPPGAAGPAAWSDSKAAPTRGRG